MNETPRRQRRLYSSTKTGITGYGHCPCCDRITAPSPPASVLYVLVRPVMSMVDPLPFKCGATGFNGLINRTRQSEA